jgi:copper resistance protein B
MNIVRRARFGAALSVALPICCSGTEPPHDTAPDMSYQTMAALMDMDDSAATGKVMVDELELQRDSASTVLAWDAQAWYGGDYDRLWFKTEGMPDSGDADTSRNELLWNHSLTRWWNLQTGVRWDLGQGPARGWAALGFQGLAPYWFDVEATLYVGGAGRTAARFRVEHDFLITQRLIMQPEIEANLYGKDDAARQISAGLSQLQLGFRVRYEVRREVAPYLGVVWRHDQSGAPLAQAGREGAGRLQWVAGLHCWW